MVRIRSPRFVVRLDTRGRWRRRRQRVAGNSSGNGGASVVRVPAYTCAGAFDGHGESRRAGGGVAINYAEKLRSMEERAPLKY